MSDKTSDKMRINYVESAENWYKENVTGDSVENYNRLIKKIARGIKAGRELRLLREKVQNEMLEKHCEQIARRSKVSRGIISADPCF